MKHIIKVEVLENLPKTRPLIAMDRNKNLFQEGKKEPVGPADNEIWYWGEYYDLENVISILGQYGLSYTGPNILSNEQAGDKYVITFEESVTKLGGNTELGEFYPVFINESFLNVESNITRVEIPNSVTFIGETAFLGCSLTSITIPNSVTYIGDNAFQGCSSLTSITIPNSVTSIGRSAFWYCPNLVSLTIGNNVALIGDGAFYGCSSLTSITIPNSVTRIEASAFKGCKGLISVIIGNNVPAIGGWTFSECSSLTSVTIGNSVTSIENDAFSHCSSLTSVTIPNSVTSIEDSAFGWCDSLSSITCEATTPPSLGHYAFLFTNINTIRVPVDSVDAYKAAENWSEYADRIQAIQ